MNVNCKKECFKCKKIKDMDDFYKHKQMKDGRLGKCKDCSKSDVRKNYRSNIDHYKNYEKARAGLDHRVKARNDYAKTENGKCRLNAGTKAWRARNPIKRMASTIVRNAVRGGKLFKPDNCESCESTPNRLHGHHDDYAFPLIVRWLCPGCHNKWHKENGEGLNAS
jgi:hypothetical protein